jgi:tetratricopeptide (TPR) repeat protein
LKRLVYFAFVLTLISTCAVLAQNESAHIKEYDKVFKTYPFSDPNPIPINSKIYPYFRFDGYTDQPVDKEWKVVELENDYIKVLILPEIGGKIWAAIEKSTGKSFLYYNHVVKFRDIAMRGPWTSGGIEANYGIIGHTPNCATPVDYVTQTNPDGSVSCYIGVLDLLTRTNWRLEINLQKDKAYFTTTSFWHNNTPLEQPYYTWMNVGLKAAGNLEFIYPGTHYLEHGGDYADWPVNKENGKNISFYEGNDFGSYKSYHVFGKYTNFFGSFWHDENFGMGRYSTHDDKPGKKIWIWGLSQQGMIWENLLTDTDGQYVEVQSGRLFNQAAGQSTQTPFKHRGFSPYASDTWTEYWFPVVGTNGMNKANPFGSLNVKRKSNAIDIYFSPVQNINDTLKIVSDGKVIYEKYLKLSPLQLFTDSIKMNGETPGFIVHLGKNKLVFDSDENSDTLNRPKESPKDFDWGSVYGKYVQGKELLRQKNYRNAEERFEACLQANPYFIPALTNMSMLMIRRLDFQKALAYSRTALSVNTYDPAANYYYAIANLNLGRIIDAKDGFDLAAASVEYRSAAFTQLAKIYFNEKNFQHALNYTQKSLDYNRLNMETRQLEAVIYRVLKNKQLAAEKIDQILAIDPLNHCARFEKYQWQKSDQNKVNFISLIRNELPDQTFLELAIWYESLDRFEESSKLLQWAPQTPEMLYWCAWAKHQMGEQDYASLIQQAHETLPAPAYPFRAESAKVLRWIQAIDKSWQPKFNLALIHWNRNNQQIAEQLFLSCGEEPDYAPFYASRSRFFEKTNPTMSMTDLQKAMQLNPRQWRYEKMLVERLIKVKKYTEALQKSSGYFQKDKDSYIMGMLYAKSLLHNQQYQECAHILKSINILPYEGATDGRSLWQEANLLLSLDKIEMKKFDDALEAIINAKKWPENLGVGKPYEKDIDERLENWLEYICRNNLSQKQAAQKCLDKIVSFEMSQDNVNNLIAAWAWEQLGNPAKGESILAEWIQKDANSQLAKSCLKIFNKNTKSFPETISHNVKIRALERYLEIF